MTTGTHAAIRRELEKKLQELIERVERIDDDLSQPGDEDWEERAQAQEGDEVMSAVGNLSVQEIEQIRHALQRMDRGTYGVCEKCGGSIAEGRLEALPFATVCSNCA